MKRNLLKMNINNEENYKETGDYQLEIELNSEFLRDFLKNQSRKLPKHQKIEDNKSHLLRVTFFQISCFGAGIVEALVKNLFDHSLSPTEVSKIIDNIGEIICEAVISDCENQETSKSH